MINNLFKDDTHWQCFYKDQSSKMASRKRRQRTRSNFKFTINNTCIHTYEIIHV